MQPQSGKSKKPYHKPQFSVYGGVDTFTSSVGNGTLSDNAASNKTS